MKKFRTYIAVLCTMLVAAACTNEMETTTATDVAQLVKIGGFPAFEENAQTRAIGTPDAGKIAWATNDVVLLKIQLKNGGTAEGTPYCYVLTYDGSTWEANKPLNITLTDYRQKAEITAYYAPDYEWNTTSAGTLALKTGKTAGTDELLVYTATNASLSDGISIDFSGARTYSRLRVAAAPDMTVTLTAAAFTAVGTTTALGTNTITATADAKGNAYFYGSWTENATLAVELKEGETTLTTVSKTAPTVSAAGSSYALDGFASLTAYTAVGAGTADSPYRIYNATQLMNFNTEFVKLACNKHIKLMNDIDLTGKTWTPISGVADGGIIDGNFHTIKGMTMVSNSNRKEEIGFCQNNKETIKNLTIDNATITNNETVSTVSNVGVFAAQNNGKIMNCHVLNGTITAPNAGSIGGLVSNNSGSVIGCSVINTTIVRTSNYIGGLISTVASSGVMKGCMFCGSLNINNGDEGGIVLAAEMGEANATLTSVYCQNTYTGAYITKTLWGSDVSVTPTNCAYVDGTTTTWDAAITDMNAAIKSDITEYKYEYDATLGCPKMVKAKK